MLRGDVTTTPLPDLLKRLSDAKATGCVYVQPAGRQSPEATVGLRNGAICNVTLPGSEEAIGTRLVASRHLTPADLAEAREAQETELSAWTLAELLIHLGLADQETVEQLVLEQALAALTELCEWTGGTWRFRRRERTGPSLPSPLDITAALAAVADRQAQWQALSETVHSADAVVSLAAHPGSSDDDPNLEMDADGFALLCAVDGAKTVAELAGSTGFTLLAAGHKIAALIESGLVQVTHPSHDETDDDLPGEEDFAGDASVESDEGTGRGLAAIAAAFSVNGPAAADLEFGLTPVGAPWQPPRTANGDTLADALARVSAALSEAMTAPVDHEVSPEAAVLAEVAAQLEVEAEVPDVAEPEAVAEPEIEAEPEVEAEPEIETPTDVEATAEPDDDEYLAAVITLPFAAAEPDADDDATSDEVAAEVSEPVEPQAEEVVLEGSAQVETEAEAEVEVEVEALEVDLETEAEPEPEPDPEPVAESQEEPEAVDEPVEVADDPAEPTRESRASAANAARLLSEFSEESGRPRDPEPEPEGEGENPPAVPEGHAPRPRRENGFADTAALLRELSSLGTETSTPAPRMPLNRPAAPTPNPGQHARKRKGLFGRS